MDPQSIFGGLGNVAAGASQALGSMTQDPTFLAGLGLMSAGQPGNPGLFRAYQALQGQRAFAEQQKMNAARIAQEQAQTQLAGKQVDLYGQEVEQRKAQTDLLKLQQQRQQAQWDMGMKFLQQLRPDLAGQVQPPVQVQPPNAPPGTPPVTVPGPPNIPAAQQAASVGKHGTPNLILDNLMKTESGGNPTAIGPPIPGSNERAMGPYQFLPSTIATLRKTGYTFDPFNVQQSRDAADYYLQQLLQQNGGDWNKAIAAYGGFKSKDPTAYVQKVTAGFSGSPEQQAAASVRQSATQAQLDQLSAQSAAARRDQQAAGVMRFMLNDPAGLSEAAKAGQPDYKPMELGLTASGQQETQRHNVVEESQGQQRIGMEAAKTQNELKVSETAQRVAHADAYAAAKNSINSLDMLNEKITGVLNHPGLAGIFGPAGKVPNFPGSKAADAAAQLDSVATQIGLDSLTNLKKSGASLGQVSNYEDQMLQKSLENLANSQSLEQAKTNLGEVQKWAQRAKNVQMKAYEMKYGESPLGSDVPIGTRMAKLDSKGKPVYRGPDGKLFQVSED